MKLKAQAVFLGRIYWKSEVESFIVELGKSR